jgi:DNA polymerase
MVGAKDMLDTLAADAAHCTRCPLYRNATQTVFGDGPATARLMLVGEQPGDSEDCAGLPFIGPAGRILNMALDAAGIDRRHVYLTNAVKHFKNMPRGKRRIHQRPDRYEIERCRWWLDREITILRPALAIALGTTAAMALTGHSVTIAKIRGRRIALRDALDGLVTVHPSYILRLRGEAKDKAFGAFVADLTLAAELAAEVGERHHALR